MVVFISVFFFRIQKRGKKNLSHWLTKWYKAVNVAISHVSNQHILVLKVYEFEKKKNYIQIYIRYIRSRWIDENKPFLFVHSNFGRFFRSEFVVVKRHDETRTDVTFFDIYSKNEECQIKSLFIHFVTGFR